MPSEPDRTQTIAGGAAFSQRGTFGAAAPAAGPVAPPLIPGFRLTRRIGEGGMGVVWHAEQAATKREVAVKVLPGGSLGSAKAQQRFEREVALAALLDHPGIAQVFESGAWSGGLYYAMRYVDGADLDRFVQEHQLAPKTVVELVAKVCDAVQHAHQRGVIHRDLKPSNILVTPDGTPVVVDFGLAKAVSGEGWSPEVSIAGEVAGTVAYMSPEQAAGDAAVIDTRSDVFSLGVILYKLLVGQHPHDLSGSQADVLRRIQTREIRRPSRLVRGISRDLEAILVKALELDPDRRYNTAGELAADLRRLLGTEPVLARRQTLGYIVARKVQKHRRPLGVLGASALVALGVTWWLCAQEAKVPIYTDPPGALIFINGREHFCPSNCSVYMDAGTHEIVLRYPRAGHASGASYHELKRTVRVAWGGYTFAGTSTAVLTPAFQFIRFEATPAGSTLVLTRADDGVEVFRSPAPVTARVDAGQYRAAVESPAGDRVERDLHVLGSSEPRTERFDTASGSGAGGA